MFGAFRFFLALAVAIFHIDQAYGGYFGLKFSGSVAVFGFYVLSGFLIDRVLCERYLAAERGLVGFAANRLLRIFPAYLLFLSVAVIVYVALPETRLAIPTEFNWQSVLANITTLGLLRWPSPFIPPAYSIGIELVHYAAMALLLSRSRRLVIMWWIVSLGISAYFIGWSNWRAAYFSHLGPTICFSTGAMIYRYRAGLTVRSRLALVVALTLAFVCTYQNALHFAGWIPVALGRKYNLYAAVVAMALAVICLQSLSAKSAPPWLRRLDDLLGDLSFPVFLCHWSCVSILRHYVFDGYGLTELAIFVSMVLSVSYVAVILVERPVQGVRDRVREWIHGQGDSRLSGS